MSADIDAATLVREARQAEAWIESVQSFRLRAECHLTRTPEGLAIRRAEYKKQFPDLDPTPTQFPDLHPESRITIESAFDQRRISFRYDDPTYLHDRRIWDGQRGVCHEFYPHAGKEHYAIFTDPHRTAGQMVLSHLSWPRAAAHRLWWDHELDEAGTRRFFGNPEDFTLVGRESYRDIDCFVLELDNRFRWYVGTADHRLYGKLHLRQTLPHIELWSADYTELSPGRWLPMTQGVTFWNTYASDYDYTDDTPPIITGTKLLRITDVQLDQPLPDDLFEIRVREGVDVYEWDHNPPLIYKHRDHWTPETWQAILDEANERQRREDERTHAQDTLIGRPAPEFTDVAWINSPPLTLAALAGKPVVVAFWSADCGPCRNDFPVLRELHARGPAAGVHVIALHGPGPSVEEVSAAAKKFDLPYPICVDLTAELFEAYECWRLPSAVLLDGRGRIAAHGTLHEMLAAARRIATDGNAAG